MEQEHTVHILLVDDRKENLLALKALLNEPGYHLLTAQSGEEALRLLLKHECALILLDVRMPGLDGFQTARMIREREKTRNLPIIFLTAESHSAEDVRQGYTYHAIDYIFKPFNRVILQTKVAVMAELHRKSALLQQQSEQLMAANTALEREIERRKDTERALREAKEIAEAANRSKSEFLANMSHELRTPLNAILGYSQIFAGAENLTEQQADGLKTIKRSGDHLLSMINDILDLSKIEAGRMELDVREVHLPEFLNGIADMIRIRALHQGIDFIYAPAPDLPTGVRADEKRLREILINLLGNAVKFTEQGNVTFKILDCRLQIADLDDEKSQIKFEISDTGRGIPASKHRAIFLPFQQAGGREYTDVEGTGLGLAISHKLVSLMGGELRVRSTVGEGSTFWFELELPRVADVQAEDARPDRPISGYGGQRRTILIADDKQPNRIMLHDMLTAFGFTVIEAVDGRECCELAAQHQPDMILLDLMMPVMNGFEAAKRIRETESSHTPIIAVSASVFEKDQQESRDAGCDDFLKKPFQSEELTRLLRKYLQVEWTSAAGVAAQAEAEPPVDMAALLAMLPPRDAETLHDLAAQGNRKKVLEQLQQIEELGAQFVPLVKELRALAKNFDFDTIAEMLG